MAISETQLSTWSNQGATVTSQSTYNSIKTCLKGNTWNDVVKYKIYLQGSYKNFTNIYGNSDVDIVVELTTIFHSNKTTLPSNQLMEFNKYYGAGKYTLQSFKNDIVLRLKSYYGSTNVEVGNKAIRIKGGSGRLEADVVVCSEYRKFNSFSMTNPNDYTQGIIFWENRTGGEVTNYPNLHFQNGAAKNKVGNTNFKPAVRILKNMKAKLVANGDILKTTAPSYFIECLAYNVPTYTFKRKTWESIIIGVLEHWGQLTREKTLGTLITQNRQRYLIGNNDQQWNLTDANIFITKIIDFWNAG